MLTAGFSRVAWQTRMQTSAAWRQIETLDMWRPETGLRQVTNWQMNSPQTTLSLPICWQALPSVPSGPVLSLGVPTGVRCLGFQIPQFSGNGQSSREHKAGRIQKAGPGGHLLHSDSTIPPVLVLTGREDI